MTDPFDAVFPNLSRPAPFLRARKDRLLEHTPAGFGDRLPRRLQVVTTARRGVDAVSERRTPGFLGYRISVYAGLMELLQDAITLLEARTEIVNALGQVVTPVDLSDDEAVAILKDMVVNYVRHRRWRSPDGLMTAKGRSMFRRLRGGSPAKLGWYAYWRYTVDFILAHEMAHILLGHCDRQAPSDCDDRWHEEMLADEIGNVFVKAPLYPGDFGEGDNAVRIRMIEQVNAFVAVALVFEMLALICRVAERSGQEWTKTHPPGDVRYCRFREFEIVECGMPERMFSEPVAGLGAPDHIQRMFHEMGDDVLRSL